jgi:hypothetical protein
MSPKLAKFPLSTLVLTFISRMTSEESAEESRRRSVVRPRLVIRLSSSTEQKKGVSSTGCASSVGISSASGTFRESSSVLSRLSMSPP